MNRTQLDTIVHSVLYEGYMLYPYRRSSLKNRHRWNFGLVYPEGMSPNRMMTECLLEGDGSAKVDVEVRFLQVYEQDSWQDPIERSVRTDKTGIHRFTFGSLSGEIEVQRERVRNDLDRIHVEITNRSTHAKGDDAMLRCLVSTHTILTSPDGKFVSLLDPPEEYRDPAAACRNVGTWPVLVGNAPERDGMLSSPIILYDYTRVADESPTDLFDSTEIDEILTLRILTLSEAEKDEMRHSGERERRLLEHVESLSPEQLLKLHGTMRDVRTGLQRGDRVKLRPKPGGDVFDVALAGRIAIVESIEQDFDNRTHVAVVVEDDPGKDLGFLRQPGHRFFFSADEVERIG